MSRWTPAHEAALARAIAKRDEVETPPPPPPPASPKKLRVAPNPCARCGGAIIGRRKGARHCSDRCKNYGACARWRESHPDRWRELQRKSRLRAKGREGRRAA